MILRYFGVGISASLGYSRMRQLLRELDQINTKLEKRKKRREKWSVFAILVLIWVLLLALGGVF